MTFSSRSALLMLWGLLVAGVSLADSLETLAQFLQGTRSARADFTQSVQQPPREGQALRPKVSSGQFAFLRPARFRFEYQRPYPQLLLGDGTTLWVYDAATNTTSGALTLTELASGGNLDIQSLQQLGSGSASVTTSLRGCTPAPPQVRHPKLTNCPAPPHASHALVNTMWPREIGRAHV